MVPGQEGHPSQGRFISWFQAGGDRAGSENPAAYAVSPVVPVQSDQEAKVAHLGAPVQGP